MCLCKAKLKGTSGNLLQYGQPLSIPVCVFSHLIAEQRLGFPLGHWRPELSGYRRETPKCFPATTGHTTFFLMKAEIFLHSLMTLQAKASSPELTVAQGAVNDGPGKVNALAVQ